MADNSNKFSLNGLNRQKYLSGLYARRPENIDQYFDTISLPIPPTFVSILSADVIESGSNYSSDTTISFPSPEHPEGTRATAIVCLGLTDSLSIQNGGSDYKIGDTLYIFNTTTNTTVGFALVSNVDTGGAITDLSIIQTDIIYSNDICIVFGTKNSSAVITIPDNKYYIRSIFMTNFGSGYQTYSRTSGETISHNPTLQSSSGSGAVIHSSKKARIVATDKKNNRYRGFYKNKYGGTSFSKNSEIEYTIIKNFSLSDPTR